MEKKFSYFTNGLQINSDIEIPELTKRNGEAQISIHISDIGKELPNTIHKDKFQQISITDYQLEIENVARYRFTFPNKIVIQPFPHSSIQDVRLYLLASIIPVAVLVNNFIPLHSCCIQVNGKAILVGGVSGAGKSTLALGMYKKGYEILNDDISTIGFDNLGNPRAFSGFKQIKLWEESLAKYGFDPLTFNRVKDDMSKYRFPLKMDLAVDSLPIKAIYLFQHDEKEEEVLLTPLKGIHSVTELTRNTFRVELISILQQKMLHFERCTKLAQKVKVISVSRPKRMEPSEFADFMENTFLQECNT